MDELHQTGLSYDWYFRTSKWLAATVALIVVRVLVGWTCHINRPTRLSPDLTAMKVTTAIGLLFLAGALLLPNPHVIRPDSRGTRIRNSVVFVSAAMAEDGWRDQEHGVTAESGMHERAECRSGLR